MKLININKDQYVHMIPLWKSPIKLPFEATRWSYPLDARIKETWIQGSKNHGCRAPKANPLQRYCGRNLFRK